MASAASSRDADFQTTRWSLVAALEDAPDNDDTMVRQRLLELCLRYWYPVYVYLRRSGHPPAAAQALTARFFATLLHARASGGRGRDGRFRTWLLAELHRFLATPATQQADPIDSSELPIPPLDALERRRAREDPDGGSPELALQRGVALELIARAMQRIENEATQAGRLPMFAELQPFLASDPLPGVYADIAQRLDVSPLFLSLALKRLRERFRELVDGELVQTVASASALDAERRILHAALSGSP